MRYWLLKSEPDTFSIDHLVKATRQTTTWDGVRNFQARNFLREMAVGDKAFLYHSSCAVPGVAGIMTVVRTAYPDPTAFDPDDHHFDPKSRPDSPTWYAVDLKLDTRFSGIVALDTLREYADAGLQDLIILRRGNRLSVTPVTKGEWDLIHSLAKSPAGKIEVTPKPPFQAASRPSPGRSHTSSKVRTRRKSVKK